MPQEYIENITYFIPVEHSLKMLRKTLTLVIQQLKYWEEENPIAFMKVALVALVRTWSLYTVPVGEPYMKVGTKR